jgi:hypothetical protein
MGAGSSVYAINTTYFAAVIHTGVADVSAVSRASRSLLANLLLSNWLDYKMKELLHRTIPQIFKTSYPNLFTI